MHTVETIDDLKLVGGWLCLDFSNTADWINGQVSHDWVNSEDDLLVWGERVGLLTGRESRASAGGEAVQTVRDLRELIHRMYTSLANGQQPDEADLNAFNGLLRDAMRHVEVSRRDDGYQWEWQGNPSPAMLILWSVIRSAAELLTASELRLLRQCPAEDCGWLFLDTSRNHSRRWCDMDDCGNRAKARSHYARSKNT